MTKKSEPEPAELLAKFNSGEKILPLQTAFLVERLKCCVSEEPELWDFDELYEIVITVSKLQVYEAAVHLERLLLAQEPLTICLVLETLCVSWDRTEEYLERVMTFAVGAVWDDDLDVQEKAIEILGSYARKKTLDSTPGRSQVVQRVLEALWQQFASVEEPTIIRSAAYRALLSASGMDLSRSGVHERALRTLFKDLPEVADIDALPSGFDKDALRVVFVESA